MGTVSHLSRVGSDRTRNKTNETPSPSGNSHEQLPPLRGPGYNLRLPCAEEIAETHEHE